ncbi:MAG TPA: hypothetical protein PK280_05765 [Planctomycetota bacterium]|nr:hypothetical protein [Planctomycetota bacterium]
MAFWCRDTIRTKQDQHGLITPFDEKRLTHSAYEMALGPEAFITSQEHKTKIPLAEKEQICIPSGQFALLITEERVYVPEDAIAFISVRTGKKSQGLVNVSGFHVDPGFKGRLKFSVYNAGSKDICLARGEPIFMIWYSDLDKPTSKPYANRAESDGVTSEDVNKLLGYVSSPPELQRQLNQLRSDVASKSKLLFGLHGGLAALVLVMLSVMLGSTRGCQPGEQVNSQPVKQPTLGAPVPDNANQPVPPKSPSVPSSPAPAKGPGQL